MIIEIEFYEEFGIDKMWKCSHNFQILNNANWIELQMKLNRTYLSRRIRRGFDCDTRF